MYPSLQIIPQIAGIQKPTKEEERREREGKSQINTSQNIGSNLRGHDFFVALDQPGVVLTKERLQRNKTQAVHQSLEMWISTAEDSTKDRENLKMITGEMACWGSLYLIYRSVTHSQQTFRYFGSITKPKGKMIQLTICPFDSHVLFMTLLCLDTSFAMTPRASSCSCRNSN
jgi:hypothetical protein